MFRPRLLLLTSLREEHHSKKRFTSPAENLDPVIGYRKIAYVC
jgi:hypothetical protein